MKIIWSPHEPSLMYSKVWILKNLATAEIEVLSGDILNKVILLVKEVWYPLDSDLLSSKWTLSSWNYNLEWDPKVWDIVIITDSEAQIHDSYNRISRDINVFEEREIWVKKLDVLFINPLRLGERIGEVVTQKQEEIKQLLSLHSEIWVKQ